MTSSPSAQTPEISKSIVAMGLKTNYHDLGSGDPVVLLHGSGPGVSAWSNWRLLLPAIAAHSRVIAFDLSGFGYTEIDPKATYTIDYWLQHLTDFLDAMKLDRVAFLGNSFGGVLATHFALRHPERVTRIAGMGANLLSFPITEAMDEAWGYTPSPEKMRRIINSFPYDKSLINEELLAQRLKAGQREGYWQEFAKMFPAPRQQALDRLTLKESDLAKLQCEVLLIHGREDFIVPVDVSVRANAVIPRCQLHTFGHCGHWVTVERTREMRDLVNSFFGPR